MSLASVRPLICRNEPVSLNPDRLISLQCLAQSNVLFNTFEYAFMLGY